MDILDEVSEFRQNTQQFIIYINSHIARALLGHHTSGAFASAMMLSSLDFLEHSLKQMPFPFFTGVRWLFSGLSLDLFLDETLLLLSSCFPAFIAPTKRRKMY